MSAARKKFGPSRDVIVIRATDLRVAQAVPGVGTDVALGLVGQLETVEGCLLARGLEERRTGRSAVIQALAKRQTELRVRKTK